MTLDDIPMAWGGKGGTDSSFERAWDVNGQPQTLSIPAWEKSSLLLLVPCGGGVVRWEWTMATAGDLYVSADFALTELEGEERGCSGGGARGRALLSAAQSGTGKGCSSNQWEYEPQPHDEIITSTHIPESPTPTGARVRHDTGFSSASNSICSGDEGEPSLFSRPLHDDGSPLESHPSRTELAFENIWPRTLYETPVADKNSNNNSDNGGVKKLSQLSGEWGSHSGGVFRLTFDNSHSFVTSRQVTVTLTVA
jgi:hypothetical protein